MTTRTRFELRIPPEERERLRALAADEGKSQSTVVRDLVCAAVAQRRAVQAARWGPRLFGTEASPDEAT